jgi:hypothetical protein
MAKAKKTTAKRAKKTTKPTRRTRRRATVPRLSASDKAGMLKPGEDLDELIDDVLAAWRRVGKKVHAADVTAAKLAALSRRAVTAAKREAELAARQAAKLAPLSDARMRTADAAYRAALKVKRVADAVAESDPDVADAFASVAERFRARTGAASETSAPTSTG